MGTSSSDHSLFLNELLLPTSTITTITTTPNQSSGTNNNNPNQSDSSNTNPIITPSSSSSSHTGLGGGGGGSGESASNQNSNSSLKKYNYKCQYCLHLTKFKAHIIEHMQTAHNINLMQCPYFECGRKFKDEWKLKRHLLTNKG